MNTDNINVLINQLEQLDCRGLYLDDFLLTWEKNR